MASRNAPTLTPLLLENVVDALEVAAVLLSDPVDVEFPFNSEHAALHWPKHTYFRENLGSRFRICLLRQNLEGSMVCGNGVTGTGGFLQSCDENMKSKERIYLGIVNRLLL